MSEEAESTKESPGGIIKQTIDSATALVKAVPIYEDAVQPLAREAGKALGTLGKAVNVALAPISLVVWGYDQMQIFLETKVTDKLEKVPEERITTPPPNVAGPAIEALKFTGHDETLQDMFANLIANALDAKTAIEAHPSFVDIIKNLSSDEGLILKLFTATAQFPLLDVKQVKNKGGGFRVLHRNVSLIGELAHCKHPQLTPNYLDNLCRLGVLEILSGRRLDDPEAYKAITSDPVIDQLSKQFQGDEHHSIGFDQKMIQVTSMGEQFINACIVDKRARS